MAPVASYGQDVWDFAIAGTPHRISLASNAGALMGQAEEIVYKYDDRDDKLSQLLWDLKPLVYVGSTLSFSRSDPLSGLGATADLSVKFGLPLPSGTMEDRDWVKKTSDTDVLTHFSTHDAFVQGAMLLDFSGGISIPVKSAVTIRGLVSFSYMRFSWIARDGYTQYDEANGWDASLPKSYVQGTGISYDQNWFIFSPGIGLFWPFHRTMSLDFRFFLSPLIYLADMDNHYYKNSLTPRGGYDQYIDVNRGGLYLEPSLDFTFSPNSHLSLVVHGSWRHISGARGDTYKTLSGVRNNYVGKFLNRAGAGFSAFDAGLSFKFTLPLGLLGNRKTRA
jgi:outer membrane protease